MSAALTQSWVTAMQRLASNQALAAATLLAIRQLLATEARSDGLVPARGQARRRTVVEL
jgi:hypothetical protein